MCTSRTVLNLFCLIKNKGIVNIDVDCVNFFFFLTQPKSTDSLHVSPQKHILLVLIRIATLRRFQ